MKNNNELYEAPAISVVELHFQSHILTGSPGTESAGIQDYLEQSEKSW
jgi:hypothetical protein